MCGRYVSPEEGDIERHWNLTRINWKVAPTYQVPALRSIEAGAAEEPNGTELVALRWGLIPYWANGVAPKVGTIMATCAELM